MKLRLAVGGGMDGGVDEDQDGYDATVDCDDLDPARHPGATEVCDNQRDENCNGRLDCEEDSCAAKSCGASGGATCSGFKCREQQCSDGEDNNRDGLIDCVDPDCAGAMCGVEGLCTNGRCVAGTEVGLCADGQDNDGDGLVDCADRDDCDGQACHDGDFCSVGDTCQMGTCRSGSAKSCPAPANTCLMPMGMCVNDAGAPCAFMPRTSGGCDDGLKCTSGETCGVDGACRGPRVMCPSRGQCFSAGACQESLDGGCSYTLLTGGCDDGENCTINDTCGVDGGCHGTRVNCGTPGDCFNPSTSCTPTGTCIFPVRTGACAGGAGTCQADGGCFVPPVFSFPVSNFTETQLPARSGSMSFNCGITTVTSKQNGTVTWANNCGGNPSPAGVLAGGGTAAALVYVDGLTVATGATLRVEGEIPVIFAVRSDAVINGAVTVNSVKGGIPGAGANLNCNAGAGGNGTSGGATPRGGGGGGAGFGAAGGAATAGSGGTGAAGPKGMPRGSAMLVPLEGGCRGGDGGRVNGQWGQGGNGGGAVQFSVAGTLTVNGSITASGSGGRGGQVDQRIGGGGGGSGGGVLLEAATVTIATTASVNANGGGGGEGSGVTASYNGADGNNGAVTGGTAAIGGASAAYGGNGGPGGARLVNEGGPALDPSPSNHPGGGGGGGVGRIRIVGTACSIGAATTSPTASTGGGCPNL